MTLQDPSPALGRLFGPRLDEFTRAWGVAALLATRADRAGDDFADLFSLDAADELGDDFADLFSLDAVDELIAHRGLRTPFLRMAKGGSTLPESSFTLGGGVGAGVGDQVSDDRVRRHFADGATIVLQGLHRTWAPLTEFGQALAAELGHPVQINGYITPPQNQGFADHYDIHDVFVLQVHGTKQWIVHDPVLRSPLRSQTWDQRAADVARVAAEPPTLEATLAPGDCLYLPRGFVHAAKAQGEISAHLTIGIHTWTGQHLADALLDAARAALVADESVRGSLPLGVDVAAEDQVTDATEAVRARLLAALSSVGPDAVAATLLGRSRAGQRAGSVPPLAQLAAADALGPDTVLHLRPHLLATLEEDAHGHVAVRSRAGRFTVAGEHRPALERLLAAGSLVVDEAAASPDVARDLARTLLLEGVATA